MPNAVTHVLLTIIAIDLYRDYVSRHKRYFTMHTLFIAGIAGLLPDIDVPIGWLFQILNLNLPALLQHGYITHTALFGLVFLIPGIILWIEKKHKFAVIFFVICFGILFHCFFDYLIGGGRMEGIMWFFPFSTEAYRINLLSRIGLADLPTALDAIILLLWLYHEELKHKISDFF